MRNVLILCLVLGLGGSAFAQDILVYDQNSNNQYAQTAAMAISPAGTVVAGASNFNTLLTSQDWDVVAVDLPSTKITGGWGPFIDYVNAGGAGIVSYWDWDADPALVTAMGADSYLQSISTVGQTLSDTGETAIFSGVTMPHSSWFDSWFDDGDTFDLSAGSVPIATMSGYPSGPVMFTGNGGRTIGSFVIDEWQGDGAVQLWTNMITFVPEPGSLLLLGGLVALIRRR